MADPDRSLLALTATEMVARVRRREVSAVDLVEASLAAIEAIDPRLNAFCLVTSEQARAEAAACDREAAAGRLRGPLHGLPIGVKDLFLTAGLATGRGSRAYAGQVPEETSPAVERTLGAGAVMVGKTTTTEFGWKASSISPLTGVTRNPWDPARTSGGSSAGSAVAVAARMVPVALGSDGGGSLRIPAAFCGAFSLKPSLGRVAYYPPSTTEVLSCPGGITRTVADSALLMDVLKGPDPRDHVSLPADPTSYVEAIGRPLPPLRCAFAPTLFDVPVDPAVARVVHRAVDAFARATGLAVDEVRPRFENPVDVFETIWVAGRHAASGALLPRHEADLDPDYLRLVREAQRFTATDVFRAFQGRAAFCRAVHAFFERYEVLLLPTLPVRAFAAEADLPEGLDTAGRLVAWTAWTPFTPPFNLTGQPAASVPCGLDEGGLPVGLQVVGRRFEDATVLQACAAVERLGLVGDAVPPVAREVLGGPHRALQAAPPCRVSRPPGPFAGAGRV